MSVLEGLDRSPDYVSLANRQPGPFGELRLEPFDAGECWRLNAHDAGLVFHGLSVLPDWRDAELRREYGGVPWALATP